MNYTSLEEKITVESGRLPYQLILSYREGCIFSKNFVYTGWLPPSEQSKHLNKFRIVT